MKYPPDGTKTDEIALRPKRGRRGKLTWAETYQQMAQANEDWTDWEAAGEGLSSLSGEVCWASRV
jgi:hypothetical protein